MKTNTKLLFLVSLFLTSITYSQIRGKCIDKYGEGIPYVNISIKGKPIETVSNMKGDFSFKNSFIEKMIL